jgi:hypothetical protein
MQPTALENPVLDLTEPVKTEDEISRSGDKDAATSLFSADKAKELGTSRNSSSEEILPTVRGSVPYRVWLVQGLVLLERAAFYGVSQPFRT